MTEAQRLADTINCALRHLDEGRPHLARDVLVHFGPKPEGRNDTPRIEELKLRVA